MRPRKRRAPIIDLFKPSPKLKAATERAVDAVLGRKAERPDFPSRAEILAEFSAAQRKRA